MGSNIASVGTTTSPQPGTIAISQTTANSVTLSISQGTGKKVRVFRPNDGSYYDVSITDEEAMTGAKTISSLVSNTAYIFRLINANGVEEASAGTTTLQPEPPVDEDNLMLGSAGAKVTALQQNLVSLGYSCTVNGTFDSATDAAVRLFQQLTGLSVNGITDPDTRSRLSAVLSDKNSGWLSRGMISTSVQQLQNDLNTLGYSCGTADGRFGMNTHNAVVSFQGSQGLSQDGIVGPTTRNVINTLIQERNDLAQVKANLVQLGYTNANSNYEEAVNSFVTEYYEGAYQLKSTYDRLVESAKLSNLLDWTTRALQPGSTITKGMGEVITPPDETWVPLSSSLIDSADFPPRNNYDGTPITADNKESSQAARDYYYTNILPQETQARESQGLPVNPPNMFLCWLRDTYGENWLESFWNGAESFIFGMGDAVASAIDGLCYVIQHPIKTAEGLLFLYKATHPVEYPQESLLLAQLMQNAIQNCWDDFTEGDYNTKCRMIGRLVGEIVLAFVSTKGTNLAVETLQNSALFTKLMSRVGKGAISADDAVIALKEASELTPETIELIDGYLGRIDDIRVTLPSALKRSGNMAIADIQINGLPSELKAFSQVNTALDTGADKGFVLLKGERIFQTIKIAGKDGLPYDRMVDTEAKILEEIANRLGNNPNATGTIQLLTENPPCASCQSVFQQFRQRYPNIDLKVLDGLYKVTDW